MKLFAKILLILIILLLLAYFLGPKASYSAVSDTPINLNLSLEDAEAYVQKKEAAIPGIKKNNQSQFFWADGEHKKTKYSIVYLHGFTASHREGFPIIQNFATRYKANMYLPRLAKHGLSDLDAMADLTPSDLINSAKEAIAIAKTIGEKVIIISTSTGSSYASYLANNDKDIAAQIMLAPNFAVNDPNSKKITGRWGKQMFKRAMGGNYREWEAKNPKVKEYWQTKARIEGYIAMQATLDQTMTESVWKKNNVPTFIGYYPKDNIISVPAIKRYAEVATVPEGKLKVVPFDDAQGHVIGSQFMNENWQSVEKEIFAFADDILQMKKKSTLVVTYPE